MKQELIRFVAVFPTHDPRLLALSIPVQSFTTASQAYRRDDQTTVNASQLEPGVRHCFITDSDDRIRISPPDVCA